MTNDELAKALCEWLRLSGALYRDIQVRYGVDLVQVVRDGKIIATFNPRTGR